MLSRLSRKIGCWLGLLAILLTTLAPTVSQTLAVCADHAAMRPAHPTMASMDDMSAMDDDDACATPPATPERTHQHPDTHTQMSNGDACGYCSLLAHLPAMPAVESLFVVAVRAREHAVATRFESVRRVVALSFAQPRAPPVAS